MAALIDNRLDTSFTRGGGVGEHAIVTQSSLNPGPSLVSSALSDGTPTIRYTIEPGSVKTSYGVAIGALRSPASYSPMNRDLIPVTPGERVVFWIDASYYAAGSTLSAMGDWGVAVAPYFAGADGRYVSAGASNYTAVPPTTASGNNRFRRIVSENTVPEGAAYAYLRLFLRGTTEMTFPGPFHLFIRDAYFGTAGPAKGGVADVGISTESRLGIVSDVYSRSREKIKLELALPDRQLVAGERVELAAAAMTASDVTWYWRQITGPPVTLNKRESTVDFTAPNVTEDTAVRIGLYASSVDGRNRSDWRYFDLTIVPALARFQSAPGAGYDSVVTKYVGYDRGPREVWNDVIPPKSFVETPRYDAEIIDLGIAPDDVQFSTAPPLRASRGAVYIDPVTGDVFRNFGEGYNETDDTLAAPRKNAWWVNPATGDILEWIED